MNPRLAHIEPPAAIAIADRVRALKASGITVAALQSGEPMFPTPEYIKSAATEGLAKNLTSYSTSQGIPELRKALSQWYQDKWNLSFSPENFIITQGASHAIYSILQTLIKEGEEVIIVDPAWPQYANMAILAGASVTRISTLESQGRLTAEQLLSHIHPNTRLLILNNPGNPSGVIYSAKELQELISIAGERGIYVLLDEVYDQISFVPGFTKGLSTPAAKQYADLILYVNSFSKTYAMTGWRIGYAILPSDFLNTMLTLSTNSITHVSTFSQYAAMVGLRDRAIHENIYTEMLAEYQQRYHELSDILDKKGITFIRPEGAFYFFINANEPSLPFALRLLEENKIAVVPGIAYGESFATWYRISFAVDKYSYQTFLNWIQG